MRKINPFENKDLISSFLFLRPAVIPAICFGCSLFVLAKDRFIFSAVGFAIFLFTFLGSDENKIFAFDKQFKIQWVIFYLIYGAITYYLSFYLGQPAIVVVLTFSIFWAYYIYTKYLSIHPNSELNK